MMHPPRTAESEFVYETLQNRLDAHGDAYATEEGLLRQCRRMWKDFSESAFHQAMNALERHHFIFKEDNGRVYLPHTRMCEISAAMHLTNLIRENGSSLAVIPDTQRIGGLPFNDGQQHALAMARSHKLSLILGPRGSGKALLIRGLTDLEMLERKAVILAPTEKAARDLSQTVGLPARGIDCGLELQLPDTTFEQVSWGMARWIIVTGVQEMTIEQLARLLEVFQHTACFCRIVLMGDPWAIRGKGDVLEQLLALDIPRCVLPGEAGKLVQTGLWKNISAFDGIERADALQFDGSFVLHRCRKEDLEDVAVREMATRYTNGESACLLVKADHRQPPLGSRYLNRQLQRHTQYPNPPMAIVHTELLCDGDPVILSKDSRKENFFSGDMGIVHKAPDDFVGAKLWAGLDHDRVVCWWPGGDFQYVKPAYALPTHKVGANRFDTVILPLDPDDLMDRRQFYTAMAAARKQVLLIGEEETLTAVLVRETRQPRSALVERVKLALSKGRC